MDKRAVSEREKHSVIWRKLPENHERSPSELFLPLFFEGFRNEMRAGQTFINFGSGTGRIAKELLAKGLNTTLVDISHYCLDEEIREMQNLFPNQLHFVQACLWDLPKNLKAASWIYCCGVLDQIPQNHIDHVLEQMAARMRTGGYFNICLEAGKKKSWWEEKLLNHFRIVSEDLFEEGLYFNCRVIPH